jgi:carbon monoxide dehydrogenase subunit G
MKGSATERINRPIEEVFAFVSNLENQDRWVEGSSETKATTKDEINVGSTFEGKFTYSGRTQEIKYEVTNLSHPNQLTVKSIDGPFPFEAWLDLKEIENQTEISNTIEAGSDHIITSIMFVLLKPFLRWQMNKQMKKELRKLKKILESD